MEEARLELTVGESIQLNDQILTVVDIHDDEITFRIDAAEDCEVASPFGDHGWTRRNPR